MRGQAITTMSAMTGTVSAVMAATAVVMLKVSNVRAQAASAAARRTRPASVTLARPRMATAGPAVRVVVRRAMGGVDFSVGPGNRRVLLPDAVVSF